MNKTTYGLTNEVAKHFLEQNVTIEPFLVELITKFCIASCYQDISRNVTISDKDYQRLKELIIAILTIDTPNTSITAYTLRLLGAATSEFVNYFDLKTTLSKRPAVLANTCFGQIQPLHNPDTVYAHLEQLLTETCRPFALEQNNTSLAYGLKISLNSILPRSDVLIFRDMLVKESQYDKPNYVSSGERQLTELTEVTSGVSLVGDPPISALQQLEQQIITVLKRIEVQFNQYLGVYLSTLLPMVFYQLDTYTTYNGQQLQTQHQLLLYQINRVAVIQAFATLFKECQQLSADYEIVSKYFKNDIQTVYQLLKSYESIPKSTIYPKFAQIAKLYVQLQSVSEYLIYLSTWHERVQKYVEDRTFTVLPDTNAKTPLFTSADVVAARSWFVKVFSSYKSVTTQDSYIQNDQTQEKSRFLRLAYQMLTQQNADFTKDLNYFRAADAESLYDADCLFNGIDPVIAFSPALAKYGVLVFANAPHCVFDLQSMASRVVVNNEKLDLPDNRVARDRVSASNVSANLTTLYSPRGYELVAFTSVYQKSYFEQNPALFLAYAIALSLSTPDYLPLIMMMDLPRSAKVLNSVQCKAARYHLLNKSSYQYFDFSPLQRNQILSDEPPASGIDSLLFRNLGAKKFYLNHFGYIEKPKSINLFEQFLIYRLSETEVQENLVSSAYSVENLLQPEILTFYADFYSNQMFQKYLDYKQVNYKMTSESLLGYENLIYKNQYQSVTKTTNEPGQLLVDEEIQTPLHFYESKIAPQYTSSEWELRARALRLYQISNKMTKQTNTYETIQKVVGDTYTVEYCDAATQNRVVYNYKGEDRLKDNYEVAQKKQLDDDYYYEDKGTNAVINYRYYRKTFPTQLYESQAKIIKDRAQISMKIDLDDIKTQADKLKKIRYGVKLY